jgi:hypothetical protein
LFGNESKVFFWIIFDKAGNQEVDGQGGFIRLPLVNINLKKLPSALSYRKQQSTYSLNTKHMINSAIQVC